MSTTAIVARPTSALAIMAERCAVDPAKLHSTLKNTVFKGATDDEMLALVVTANIYELNPLLKEMYAFPKKGGGITPMVGVDGWLKIANRQPNFNGMEVDVYGDGQHPTHATCTVYLKDRDHPVKITEYFDECRRNTEPWNQMPRRMLRNKVMIQAIRVAFGIGGIQDEDEALDISNNSEPRKTGGRVIQETNPFDNPAFQQAETTPTESAAKPEPVAAEVVADPAPSETAVADPDRPDKKTMVDDIRDAAKERNIQTVEATKRYRAYGVIKVGQQFQALTDDELYEVWKVRGIALDAQPEAAAVEGGDK